LKAEVDSQEIRGISQRLFRGKNALGHFVEDESQFGATVASYLKPDAVFSPKAPDIGFIHRRLSTGDLYFVANTANHPLSVQAKFRQASKFAEWWDPFTGRVSPIEHAAAIDLFLQPYESRLIFFTTSVAKPKSIWILDPHSKVIDLSADWNLTFNSSNQTVHMDRLHPWSEEEAFKYYSGQVTYKKEVDLPSDLSSGTSLILSFGEGTPVQSPNPLSKFNLRAFLEGPVREAAEVYVNGSRAGVVWHPPYSIDVTSWLKAGKNDLRIVVGNTAINSLAGQTLPDNRLLNDRYGERFVPQDMGNLQPLPSGLLGGLWLKATPRHALLPRHAARSSE
jgi:hypothetical protein